MTICNGLVAWMLACLQDVVYGALALWDCACLPPDAALIHIQLSPQPHTQQDTSATLSTTVERSVPIKIRDKYRQ